MEVVSGNGRDAAEAAGMGGAKVERAADEDVVTEVDVMEVVSGNGRDAGAEAAGMGGAKVDRAADKVGVIGVDMEVVSGNGRDAGAEAAGMGGAKVDRAADEVGVIGVDMEVVSGNGRIRALRHLKFPRFLPSRLSISQGRHSCCFLGNTGKKIRNGIAPRPP
jgi:hypothetical protein